MISYEKSKTILKKAKIKIKDETIKSINSLNRVVSTNIYSNINYPAGNNAAFDGYAINSKDTNGLKKKLPKKFKIIGSIAAGMKPFKKKIKKFDTAEIMTGGIIPKGFDTIIPIEQIIFAPNKKYILIDQKIKKFDHVRFAGSDYKKGEVVIKKNFSSELKLIPTVKASLFSSKISSSFLVDDPILCLKIFLGL